jgi:hypothetical protein
MKRFKYASSVPELIVERDIAFRPVTAREVRIAWRSTAGALSVSAPASLPGS